jgi:hypothetical protein
MKTIGRALPKSSTPVKSESRICFGIMWFKTEKEAMQADAHVKASGITYNGGYFHGMPCGRDNTWDHDGLFAVTN